MAEIVYMPSILPGAYYSVSISPYTLHLVSMGQDMAIQLNGEYIMSRTQLLTILGRLKALTGVITDINFANSFATFGVYGAVLWKERAWEQR